MRNRVMLALTAAVFGVAVMGGIALATPSSGVTSTTIASGTLDPTNLLVQSGSWMTQLQTKGESTLSVVENDVAPGGTFGWHSHPGPSLIIVKSGSLVFYRADDPTCTPEVRSGGEAFIDPGTDVHVGYNNGKLTAVVIVVRFLPVGAQARIDQPGSASCGF